MKWLRKKVKQWTDGDSGRFADGSRFRLAGVRAQEKNQFGASKATRTAAGMTGRSHGSVSVKPVSKSYGRTVVEMRNKDGSVNARMRKKGYTNKGR